MAEGRQRRLSDSMDRFGRCLTFGIFMKASALIVVHSKPYSGADPTARASSISTEFSESGLISTRSTTKEVVHDSFFIPALVTMGVFTAVIFLCFYMLGWCFNAERRNRRSGIYWIPETSLANTNHNSSQPQAPFMQENNVRAGEFGLGSTTGGRRQSSLQRKTPPRFPINGSRNPPPPASEVNAAGVYAPDIEHRPPGDQHPSAGPSTTPMPVTSSNPPVYTADRGIWPQNRPTISVLASDQSLTQIGSEHEALGAQRAKAYGTKSAESSPEFAMRPPDSNRAPTDHSQDYADAYGGIDQQSSANDGAGGYHDSSTSAQTHGNATNPP